MCKKCEKASEIFNEEYAVADAEYSLAISPAKAAYIKALTPAFKTYQKVLHSCKAAKSCPHCEQKIRRKAR